MDSERSSGSLIGAVARTALWTAAARARESQRDDRLFYDPYAAVLAQHDGSELLRHFHTDHAPADGNPFLTIRTRWFDDFLTAAVTGGRSQLVALGAGLDTRAYRMDWPAGTRVFELDQAEVLAYKSARLAEVAEPETIERRPVPAGLDGDAWMAALLEAGFDPGRPTAWYAEGLLFYLSEVSARRLLRQARDLSAADSSLAVDLIGTGIFMFPYTSGFLRKLEDSGSPWRFGTDEPAAYVEESGWLVEAVLEPGMAGADFGRWPSRGVQPASVVIPRSYLVSAYL